MTPKDEELLALIGRAVIALERIAGALASEAVPNVPDDVLASDVAGGLSLRQCAAKHGVGVGRVRGAIARTRTTGDDKP
jgi:hypothetical protein